MAPQQSRENREASRTQAVAVSADGLRWIVIFALLASAIGFVALAGASPLDGAPPVF